MLNTDVIIDLTQRLAEARTDLAEEILEVLTAQPEPRSISVPTVDGIPEGVWCKYRPELDEPIRSGIIREVRLDAAHPGGVMVDVMDGDTLESYSVSLDMIEDTESVADFVTNNL